jgi:catechol 2,3-dioxygenase-like lactoylglutathione lyase family enzyme
MIDHLVYATPDLEATVADFTRATGAKPIPGGAHDGHGTRNYLVSIGGSSYLEIIGPDLDQPKPAQPRPFGIDTLDRARLITWCVRPFQPLGQVMERVRSAGYDPGEIITMGRQRPDGVELVWELTMPVLDTESRGTLPFFIDWGHTTHPSFALPVELELAKLELLHPDPEWLRGVLRAIGGLDNVEVVESAVAGLRAPLRKAR